MIACAGQSNSDMTESAGVQGAACTVPTGGPKNNDGFCGVPLICKPSAQGATTGTCDFAICPTGAGRMMATLDEISQALFVPSCVGGCHKAGGLFPALDFTVTDHAMLLDSLLASSTSTAVKVSEPRIKPGDADHSVLMHKMMVTATSQNPDPQYGRGMPTSFPGSVCPDTVDALRSWIDSGSGSALP
jgi:hypothetical protein